MGVVLFFLGLILVITVHVITHRIMDLNKKKLYVISLIFAIICSFIPTTGENKSDFLYFGIPVETFVYYGGWEFYLILNQLKRIQVISFGDICSMSKRNYAVRQLFD
ncbi:hypothetical protein [Bacillus anthracis]|uniref:hypothetical protein n=1 Tax=Bacillus anthracis TaxID=1392 RepID=UPI0009B1ED06|nr:hypothetical protein [Bacillus anthracis]